MSMLRDAMLARYVLTLLIENENVGCQPLQLERLDLAQRATGVTSLVHLRPDLLTQPQGHAS